MNIVWIILIVGAYLLGSVPSAYILVKMRKGIDIRKVGSGNVGSTNTIRAAGRSTGIAVFFMDSLKGYFPALIGLLYAGETLAVLAGLAAFIGHLYPIWLSFKGGKGVATTIGIAFALMPLQASLTFAFWFLVLLLTGYVSVASCAGGVFLAVSTLFSNHAPIVYVVFSLITIVIILRHRRNFCNIKNGTEGRIFRRK